MKAKSQKPPRAQKSDDRSQRGTKEAAKGTKETFKGAKEARGVKGYNPKPQGKTYTSGARKMSTPKTAPRVAAPREEVYRDVEATKPENEDFIFGRNAVLEALNSNHEINKLLVLDGQVEGSIRKIIQIAKEKGVIIQHAERAKLNALTDGGNHQGVLAYISPYDYVELDTVLAGIKDKENCILILLDEISDPHNLGSILRSAEAFGASGVVIPKRRSVALSATVAKTAVGALEHMPVCRVTNLNQTIDVLKQNGFWIVGADMKGGPIGSADLKGRLALVLGSEGFGIARLTKEKCDSLVNIPMVGKLSSLNVSVAASIILYEASRQSHGL